jgi:hypothetical protein
MPCIRGVFCGAGATGTGARSPCHQDLYLYTGNRIGRDSRMPLLDILIVIALGTFSGTILGLAIGFVARRQEVPWALMPQKDKRINFGLVVLFSVICTAGFAWYALV